MTIEAPLFLPGVDDGTGNLVPKYSARSFRQLLDELYDEGVLTFEPDLPALDQPLRVMQRQAGANFSVDVMAGSAIIEGDDQADQGNYLARSTATENLGVEPAPGSGLHRKDLVAAEVLDAGIDSTNPNVWRLRVITGDAVADTNTAPVPALPPTAIPLAEIGPIASTTTSITDAIITDRRTAAALSAMAIFEPASETQLPSAYPHGATYGHAATANGWPLEGMVHTVKRANARVMQTLVRTLSSLDTPIVLVRYGYTSGTVDGWSPWAEAVPGGRAGTGFISTSESTTSTSATDLATVGPQATVRAVGPWRMKVTVTARISNNTAGAFARMGFAVSGASVIGVSADRALEFQAGAGNTLHASMTFLVSGSSSGDLTFTAKYWVSGGTGTFSARQMIVEPL